MGRIIIGEFVRRSYDQEKQNKGTCDSRGQLGCTCFSLSRGMCYDGDMEFQRCIP